MFSVSGLYPGLGHGLTPPLVLYERAQTELGDVGVTVAVMVMMYFFPLSFESMKAIRESECDFLTGFFSPSSSGRPHPK